MAAVADKVRRSAYKVTDDDLGALRRDGLDDDAIFELVITAAVSEAASMLDAGLRAMGRGS
jgi:hypothetical protein